MIAALLILALWMLGMWLVAQFIDHHAPIRDEDEELRLP